MTRAGSANTDASTSMLSTADCRITGAKKSSLTIAYPKATISLAIDQRQSLSVMTVFETASLITAAGNGAP